MGVWIDTDMGVDDLAAVLVAAAALPVDGISLSFGNSPLPRVLENAAGAAAAFGWTFPITRGADRAILGGIETAERILGPRGLPSRGETLPLLAAPDLPPALPALAAWLERQDSATILALGPLTNLATLALARSDLLARIGRLVWMGGAVGRGNHSASAEFNALADPEALAILIARGVTLTMIDLDACRKVELREDHITRLRAGPGPNAALLADLMGGYLDIGLSRGRPGMALYDPVAAVCLVAPELFTLAPVRLEVELAGQITRGRTVTDGRDTARANALIAPELDAAAVLARVLTTLEAA